MKSIASRSLGRESGRRLQFEGLEDRCLLATMHLLSTGTSPSPFTGLPEIPMSPIAARSLIQPEQLTAFRLNRPMLERQLREAPREFTAEARSKAIEISIPRPDGKLGTFQIVEAPVMAPELAAQFPEIKTYRGVDVDDPGNTVRLDITPQGFHAQVLGEGGTYYIDPYYHLDQSVYVSYW
ncbi:MAG TPA: hypothetical protein VIY86_05180, partial [Pirellulaceae bacterium]